MFLLVFVAVIVYIIIDSSNNNRDRGYNNEYKEKTPSLPESKIEKRCIGCSRSRKERVKGAFVVNTKKIKIAQVVNAEYTVWRKIAQNNVKYHNWSRNRSQNEVMIGDRKKIEREGGTGKYRKK